ncbi:hypothetical protein F5Y15DRAFT_164678 [Xylariaceae sp. FL0016]|nr:hypothetical protein F5Y15DRAFT_164678 [Xylariaceae sp. FL0016]
MTRKAKCGACRKAKIKCDEKLPTCGNCLRKGQDCTRTAYGKTNYRFVEVKGRVVQETQSDSTGSDGDSSVKPVGRRVALTTIRKGTWSSPGDLASQSPNSGMTIWGDLYGKQDSLLAQWASLNSKYTLESNPIDACGTWSLLVPRYIGSSEAVDTALSCLFNCFKMLAHRTHENELALRESNMKAVRCVREVLVASEDQTCNGGLLLAIQLLLVTEAFVMQSTRAVVYHTQGLTALLQRHRQTLKAGVEDEELASRVLYHTCSSGGFLTALLSDQNHELDDPSWLNITAPPIRVPGVLSELLHGAWSNTSRAYTLVPRLAKLIRRIKTYDDGADKDEAILVARDLEQPSIGSQFIQKVIDAGLLQYEPTTMHELINLAPFSLRFNSQRLYAFLLLYWAVRILICGLLESLVATIPSSGILSNLSSILEEDIGNANHVAMSVQYGLGPEDRGNDILFTATRKRLVLPLQFGFGSWHRLEKRGSADEVLIARSMKELFTNLNNKIYDDWGRPHATVQSMEYSVEWFAGTDYKNLAVDYGT